MDHNETRLILIIAAGMFSFLAGSVGLAFVSDEVKDRVDRRVDRRCLPARRLPAAPAPLLRRPRLMNRFASFRMAALLAALPLVGCSGSLLAADQAPTPPAISLPSSAPDDPTAYRGLRWTPTVEFKVLVENAVVPWLEYRGGSMGLSAGGYSGREYLFDGRREMVWFTRSVGPMPAVVPGTLPPGSLEPNGPEEAVLDVVVKPADLPEATFSDSCRRGGSVDSELLVLVSRAGQPLSAWQFSRSAGRVTETKTKGISCRWREEDDMSGRFEP